MLYLRLRAAVREQGPQIVELAPAGTGYVAVRGGDLYTDRAKSRLWRGRRRHAPVTSEFAGVPADNILVVRAQLGWARERAGRASPQSSWSSTALAGRVRGPGGGAATILAGLPVRYFFPPCGGPVARGPRPRPGSRYAAGTGRARRRPAWYEYQWGPPYRPRQDWTPPGSWRRPGGATSGA